MGLDYVPVQASGHFTPFGDVHGVPLGACQEDYNQSSENDWSLMSHNPAAELPLWIRAMILWLSITMAHVLFYFFSLIIKREWSVEGELYNF